MTDQELIAAITWQSGRAPSPQDGPAWGIQANIGTAKQMRKTGIKPVGVAVTLPAEPTEPELAAIRTNMERALVARYRQYNGDDA